MQLSHVIVAFPGVPHFYSTSCFINARLEESKVNLDLSYQSRSVNRRFGIYLHSKSDDDHDLDNSKIHDDDKVMMFTLNNNNDNNMDDVANQQKEIMDEIAWRSMKIKLEEANTRAFQKKIKSRPWKLPYDDAVSIKCRRRRTFQ
jgi:hypothetical protein